MTPFTSVKSRGLCGGLCAAYHLKLQGKDNSSQRGFMKKFSETQASFELFIRNLF
jgi:hypothetical protein